MSNQEEEFTPEAVVELTSTLDSVMDRTIAAIDKVNDQIRVLALNARIEAARAGEAGKAFNIVAMEIASLSNSSATVVANLKKRSRRTLSRISRASQFMSTTFKGTRLIDLARMNIDLIDRCLYERSCDVRWWANEASLVDVLTSKSTESIELAATRLRTILESYTVYLDLVVCDMSGQIIVNGRPDLYHSVGTNYSSSAWFQAATQCRSGREFGCQSVHPSPLINNRNGLVYSAAIRENGSVDGRAIGVLGIVFHWEAFVNDIFKKTAISKEERSQTEFCICDNNGQIIASSNNRAVHERIEFPQRSKMFLSASSSIETQLDGNTVCIGHSRSTGFETYQSGWHSLVIQGAVKASTDEDIDSPKKKRVRRVKKGTRRKVSKSAS